jgi:hypothetical protein
MVIVQTVSGSTYIQDDAAWISYYTKNTPKTSLVPQTVSSTVVSKKLDSVSLPVINTNQPILPLEKDKEVMPEVELVSPVQGAVQQARAQYARATPIKRRTRRVKKSIKGGGHRRKHAKRCRKIKKKVKRLKKKQHKKKTKLHKKRPKKRRVSKKRRDIFTE